jgi:hypothetical protein
MRADVNVQLTNSHPRNATIGQCQTARVGLQSKHSVHLDRERIPGGKSNSAWQVQDPDPPVQSSMRPTCREEQENAKTLGVVMETKIRAAHLRCHLRFSFTGVTSSSLPLVDSRNINKGEKERVPHPFLLLGRQNPKTIRLQSIGSGQAFKRNQGHTVTRAQEVKIMQVQAQKGAAKAKRLTAGFMVPKT